MYIRFPDGKDKVVTLSYDDGVVFDEKLIEIMDKHGLKGTFNINSGLYLPEDVQREEYRGRLKLSEAKELYINSGHEVAVHCLTHPFMTDIDDADNIYEITEDKKNIEREFSVITRGGAYPFGSYNDNVIKILKSCGICYFRTVESTEKFDLPENWLALNPTCHHKNPKLMDLAKEFIDGKKRHKCKMFYLWGHSYEFHYDNNWDVIENFAEYIGKREDVWYATNIEIYDYVDAYKRLQTSWDKKIIHNPTATDVWVYLDGNVFAVPAGQTIYRS